MTITPRIQEAIDFFRAAHDSIAQKSKYSGVPYWTHTEEVAEIVQAVLPDEEIIVIAALAHDYAEDVVPKHPVYTVKDVEEKFGENVRDLMLELTDVFTPEAFPKMSRAERKAGERARLRDVSSDAQTIKLADLISNTSDIVQFDPNFAQQYLVEKLLLLPLLRNGNETLYLRAYNQLQDVLSQKRWKVVIKELPQLLTMEEYSKQFPAQV